jgi:hypothetical protein
MWNYRMDAAYLTALSALAGSIVGGVTSGFGGWLNQRSQARSGQRAHEVHRREGVVSSAQTIDCADSIMRTTIETYFAPNKTMHDLNDMIKAGTGLDPLRKFSEVVRDELHLLTSL